MSCTIHICRNVHFQANDNQQNAAFLNGFAGLSEFNIYIIIFVVRDCSAFSCVLISSHENFFLPEILTEIIFEPLLL